MQDVGAQMVRLREQFGLTPQEVSERLHIRARYIAAIEEGRYEQMPGAVYARGYVHSYAEFLGMDADHVVAQCFAGSPAVMATPVPTVSRGEISAASAYAGYGRWAVLGAVVLGLGVLAAQWLGHSTADEPAVVTVAPVPEALLASLRNGVMPLPNNYACLAEDHYLGCFFADPLTRQVNRLMEDSVLHRGDGIAFSEWMVPLNEDSNEDSSETPAAEPTENAAPEEPSND